MQKIWESALEITKGVLKHVIYSFVSEMAAVHIWGRKRPGPYCTDIKNQITSQRIGHAYLFCGTRGTGKTSIAKIFARAVNCENPVDGSPCNECPTCNGINSGASLNVVEIDAASNNGVENIRDIREQVQYPPTEGKYRVYIIDEVHMLSTGAFNALLKTLEEPPSYVIFILATTEAVSYTHLRSPTRKQGIIFGDFGNVFPKQDTLQFLTEPGMGGLW